MSDKIFLGTLKKDAGTVADGENIYLTQHMWDCGWYWGFGYIGNSRTHFHIDNLIEGNNKKASELFGNQRISDEDWWIVRDLFIQAYALKKVAEVYRYGGYQTTRIGLTDILRDLDKAKAVNADLLKVLDAVWTFLPEAIARYAAEKEAKERADAVRKKEEDIRAKYAAKAEEEIRKLQEGQSCGTISKQQ